MALLQSLVFVYIHPAPVDGGLRVADGLVGGVLESPATGRCGHRGTARAVLPFGFGLAAGAMVYLVLTEFVPEALDIGSGLSRGGRPELAGGIALGVLVMLPLAAV